MELKRLLAALALALLTACATQPNAQIMMAYDLVNSYVNATGSALQRGRITPEQAAQASRNAKRARDSVDAAALALGNCKPPCKPEDILQNLQPTLLSLEAELRAREKK